MSLSASWLLLPQATRPHPTLTPNGYTCCRSIPELGREEGVIDVKFNAEDLTCDMVKRDYKS